ncbi:MAG: hypothetical protein KDA24_11745 [Deltaproteobacteria bacterium]|nr:hypothetical protein [Deltaproteobacteria bacterium]
MWVDEEGLHLALRREGGQWLAVEISTELPPDALHVEVELATALDELDPQAVSAVFVYRDDEHEADIEFSRWGVRGPVPNAQFAVAPYGPGELHRFRLGGDLAPSTHVLDWRADRVAFHSSQGGRVIEEWRHTDPAWEARDGYRLIINLWLYQGRRPAFGRPMEIIYSAIRVD